MGTVSFKDLVANYPTTFIGGGCSSYENQCAIRLSIALRGAGFPLVSYTDPTCSVEKKSGEINARGAQSLADYLWRRWGIPKKYGRSSQVSITGQTGIVFFKDITGFRDGLGDHIDLWDGKKTMTSSHFDTSKEVWFWPVE
jgi:hypothetical protein